MNAVLKLCSVCLWHIGFITTAPAPLLGEEPKMPAQKFITKAVLTVTAIAMLGTTFAANQASAAGYQVEDTAITDNFPHWDRLNIRKWPASHSQKVAHIKRDRIVFVERCIIKQGADWCKIRKGWKQGWVNGRYLRTGYHTYAEHHPWY